MIETEADTCRKFIVPLLRKAGWDDAPHAIGEQRTFTDGRIVFAGGKARRGRQKRADYLLLYRPDFPIAVVEAKARYKHVGAGLQQARDYAETLGLKFAYATNGVEIIEIDYTTCVERTVDAFPSPEDLWRRQRMADGIVDGAQAEKLLAPTYPDRSRPLRYYQEIAVNRTVQAVVTGRKRILLTLCTGSGKTAVAFQVAWKLWSSRWNTRGTARRPKMLFLADRNVLSIIKSARRIMRKDKGLNGDLDRLPMLTWIMFLKFLDDMERVEETKAALAGTDYRSVIDPPYRWRDWAAPADGLTGPDLLAFLESEEAERPDGSRGPGLFAWLKSLRGNGGERERRDVVATVFQGFSNRMESGYLLRDVVNLVDGIRFHVSEEVHTLGRLYETLLREMRDAAGDAGEFYTPRPVVRFMVEVTDPRLGETVLDPACGTGGFLSESFDHLMRQAKTEADGATVQERSVFGEEAKTLPYLLAQLNLLLHGLHAPRIDPGNALRHRLTEIGMDRRVNVILTNPPFGGEEETGILNNFPDDRRTAETALLFLQVIMRRLKRGGQGRAAVVVPNGTLFGDGIAARIKADLLESFNLHTIVRLPEGVFAPYTDIPANLIFFDTSGPTRSIWYYEQPRPEGRRKYSKTAPLAFEELAPCIAWWKDREANERAWQTDAEGLVQRDDAGRVTACNLDLKNPHSEDDEDHRSPGEIVDAIIAKERRALEIMGEIKTVLTERV